MFRLELTTQENGDIQNALILAAERYESNAVELRKAEAEYKAAEEADPDAQRIIHSSACVPMAESFEAMAERTRALLDKIIEAEEA